MLTLLAASALALWLLALRELVGARGLVTPLATIDAATLPVPPPRVAVVIAARDEAEHIRGALRSVLALDYPDLEVVVIDDRSQDATGAILDGLARDDARLRVVHVRELPGGWLGKNHALELGWRAARADWVLFSDADVFFRPDALTRAVAYAERQGLDHLVAGPKPIGGTLALRVLLTFFSIWFALSTRPWRARDPARPEHIGIGAFNLVRRRVLVGIGGFTRLRLRPDDDIKLGKLIKSAGHRQDFVEGGDRVQVPWYATVGAMIAGLEKNSFPFLDYSVPLTLGAVALTLGACVLPWAALPFAHGAAFWLDLATVLLTAAIAAGSMVRIAGLPPWYALGFPVGALLMCYTMLNSMLRILARGGVVWRGTLYPLAELKANRV